MNPILHMLSIKKAEEEMGFEILRSNGSSRPSQNPRHLVIHCGKERFNHSTHREKHLVSLIFHGGGGCLDNASPSYWESYELLKILDMEDFGVKTLSETISTLTELIYLGLRNNYIQEIPPSFGGLEKLKFLDIYLNFMVEVPNILWEMGSLCNLHMSDVIFREPLKIDELHNLEIITSISIYDWTYDIRRNEMTTNLRKLCIEEVYENSDVGALFASLSWMKSLNHLILRGFRFRSMPCLDKYGGVLDGLLRLKLDGRLARLPSVDNFPQRIHYLTLVNTCLDEDPMPVVGALPNLKVLKMRNAYAGLEMAIQRCGFLKLFALRINELWNLRNLRIGDGAMLALTRLEIKNCPHLETLPEEIGLMKDMRKLEMITTKHIATNIRNSGLASKILEVDISP